MAGYLTSSSLINQVKLEAMIPANQSTFTTDDFLSIANQELKIGMLPSILIYHQEYFTVDSAPIPMVSYQSAYPIPYRATGGKFREVFYKDISGQLRKMSRINADERPNYQLSSFQNSFVYFYLRGNDIVMLPDVSENPVGSIIFSYFFRPNDLVDESRSGTITNISVGASTTTFTLTNIPQNLTAFYQDGVSVTGFASSGVKIDVLQRKPGHKTIEFDITPVSVDVNNMTITFNNTDLAGAPPSNGIPPVAPTPSTIVMGDIICFAGECIIPQIPSDLHEVLAQRVIQRCVQALGDAQAFGMATAKLAEMEKNTGNLIDNRSEGQPTKACANNSVLRAAKVGRWGRW